MTPRHLITGPLLLALLACQGPAPATITETQPPTTVTPVAQAPAGPVGAVPVTAPDPTRIGQAFGSAAYVKINEAPVEGTSAHPGPIDLYVDKAHAELYRQGFRGPAPAGTTVVKASADGDFLAIMQKLPAGTDPAAKDWYFFETIGDRVIFDGNKAKGGGLCFSCHQSAPETDHLLGLDLFTQ